MATITKKDLIDLIAEEADQTQVITKRIIQRFLDAIVEELAAGNRLEFREFGVFEARIRPSRRARNPRTGEAVPVLAKPIVTFKAGRVLRDRLEGGAANRAHTLGEKAAPRALGDGAAGGGARTVPAKNPMPAKNPGGGVSRPGRGE